MAVSKQPGDITKLGTGVEGPITDIEVKAYFAAAKMVKVRPVRFLTAENIREKLLRQYHLRVISVYGADNPLVREDFEALADEQFYDPAGNPIDKGENEKIIRDTVAGNLQTLVMNVGAERNFPKELGRIGESLRAGNLKPAMDAVKKHSGVVGCNDLLAGVVNRFNEWLHDTDFGDIKLTAPPEEGAGSGAVSGSELMPAGLMDLAKTCMRVQFGLFYRADLPGAGIDETHLELVDEIIRQRSTMKVQFRIAEELQKARLPTLPDQKTADGVLDEALDKVLPSGVDVSALLLHDGRRRVTLTERDQAKLTIYAGRTIQDIRSRMDESWAMFDAVDGQYRLELLERIKRLKDAPLKEAEMKTARAFMIDRSIQHYGIGKMMQWLALGHDNLFRRQGFIEPGVWEPFPMEEADLAKLRKVMAELPEIQGDLFIHGFLMLTGSETHRNCFNFLDDVAKVMEESGDDTAPADNHLLKNRINNQWIGCVWSELISEIELLTAGEKEGYIKKIRVLSQSVIPKTEEEKRVRAGLFTTGNELNPINGLPSLHGLFIALEILREVDKVDDKAQTARPVWDFLEHMAHTAHDTRKAENEVKMVTEMIELRDAGAESIDENEILGGIRKIRDMSTRFTQTDGFRQKGGYDAYVDSLGAGQVSGLDSEARSRQLKLAGVHEQNIRDGVYLHKLAAAALDEADYGDVNAVLEYFKRFSITPVDTGWDGKTKLQHDIVDRVDMVTDTGFVKAFAENVSQVSKMRELEGITWGAQTLSDAVASVMCKNTAHLGIVVEPGFIESLARNAAGRRQDVNEFITALDDDNLNTARAYSNILQMADASRASSLRKLISKGKVVESDLAGIEWATTTPDNIEETIRNLMKEKSAEQQARDEYDTALAKSSVNSEVYRQLVQKVPDVETADHVRRFNDMTKGLRGEDRDWLVALSVKTASESGADAAVAVLHCPEIVRCMKQLGATPRMRGEFRQALDALAGDFTVENITSITQDTFNDPSFQGNIATERYEIALSGMGDRGQRYGQLAEKADVLRDEVRVKRFMKLTQGLTPEPVNVIYDLAEAVEPEAAVEVLYSRNLIQRLASLIDMSYSAKAYALRLLARTSELKAGNVAAVVDEVYSAPDFEWMVGAEKMLAGFSVTEEDRGRYIEAVMGAPDEVRAVLSAMDVGTVLKELNEPGFLDDVGLAAAAQVPEQPKPIYLEVAPDGTVSILEGAQEVGG